MLSFPVSTGLIISVSCLHLPYIYLSWLVHWCRDLYMMNCELLATCSALGYLEGDTYHKEPDCLGEYLSEETGKKLA